MAALGLIRNVDADWSAEKQQANRGRGSYVRYGTAVHALETLPENFIQSRDVDVT
jgi:hypothetical protein